MIQIKCHTNRVCLTNSCGKKVQAYWRCVVWSQMSDFIQWSTWEIKHWQLNHLNATRVPRPQMSKWVIVPHHTHTTVAVTKTARNASSRPKQQGTDHSYNISFTSIALWPNEKGEKLCKFHIFCWWWAKTAWKPTMTPKKQNVSLVYAFLHIKENHNGATKRARLMTLVHAKKSFERIYCVAVFIASNWKA